MPIIYITHPACHLHDPNPGHPESPERLVAIETALAEKNIALRHGNIASKDDLLLAHDAAYIDAAFQNIPRVGLNFFDPDTAVCPQSGEAALYAVGAVLDAVKLVHEGPFKHAFCGVRPPGHHAHRDHAAG